MPATASLPNRLAGELAAANRLATVGGKFASAWAATAAALNSGGFGRTVGLAYPPSSASWAIVRWRSAPNPLATAGFAGGEDRAACADGSARTISGDP
jgi:hypothetical protein